MLLSTSVILTRDETMPPLIVCFMRKILDSYQCCYRFREREYEEDREGGVPQFRGPEGSVDFDINELKKFTIEIVRKPSSNHGDSSINRNIINPDDIAPVRRPGELI
jgi:hypothetical protein